MKAVKVHKSFQDFFENQYKDGKLFQTGHRDIAHTCLIYISFTDLTMTSDPGADKMIVQRIHRARYRTYLDTRRYNQWRGGSKSVVSKHVERYPLLRYAIHFWGKHARKQIYQRTVVLAVQFLSNSGNSHCISRNLNLLALDDPSHRGEDSATGLAQLLRLHLAAHFGIIQIITESIRHFDTSLNYLQLNFRVKNTAYDSIYKGP